MARAAVVLASLAGVAVAWFAGGRRILNRRTRSRRAVIVDPEEHTTIDARGAVRSVQSAELTLPAGALQAIWSPALLERLAQTYWRFLSRCTLGLVRVSYDDEGPAVVLLRRPFVLLSFRTPQYEMDDERGIVRWRIERGLLVARSGRGADGALQIDVRRREPSGEGGERVDVEVEVSNFYPAIATAFGRWLYTATQSRIHVIVTHGFLRSLARLDLAEHDGGAVADDREGAPDPPRPRTPAAPAGP